MHRHTAALLLASLLTCAAPPAGTGAQTALSCLHRHQNTTVMAVAGDGTIYLGADGSAVSSFPRGSHGDVTPTPAFCVPVGKEDSIGAMAIARDNLYLAFNAAIAVVPRSATGVAQPTRVIGDFSKGLSGSDMGDSLGGPTEIRVSADGTSYVLDTHDASMIHAYPASVSGAVTSSKLFYPDSPGAPVNGRGDGPGIGGYVLDEKLRLYTFFDDGSIAMTAPGLGSPSRHVTTFDVIEKGPHGQLGKPDYLPLAFDGTGTLFAGANDAVHILRGASSDNARTSVLAGPRTGLTSIRDVQTDDAGNIYVFDCSASHGVIRIFAPGSTGNTEPAATIQGPHTGLTCLSAQWAH